MHAPRCLVWPLIVVFAAFLLGPQAVAQTCTPKLGAADLVEAGKLLYRSIRHCHRNSLSTEKGELQGLNIKLGRALGKQLCLTTEFVRMDFPAMVPALRGGRFGCDQHRDVLDRGTVQTHVHGPVCQAGNRRLRDGHGTKLAPKWIEDLAGKVAAIEIGTYQERKTKEANAEMVAKGACSQYELRTFTTATDATAALRAGQVDVVIIVEEVRPVDLQTARHETAAGGFRRVRHYLCLPQQESGRGGGGGIHHVAQGRRLRRPVRQVRHDAASGRVLRHSRDRPELEPA